VLLDYNLARKIILPGGIILFHDYGNPTVQVSEALENLQLSEGRCLFNISGTWLVYEKCDGVCCFQYGSVCSC